MQPRYRYMCWRMTAQDEGRDCGQRREDAHPPTLYGGEDSLGLGCELSNLRLAAAATRSTRRMLPGVLGHRDLFGVLVASANRQPRWVGVRDVLHDSRSPWRLRLP